MIFRSPALRRVLRYWAGTLVFTGTRSLLHECIDQARQPESLVADLAGRRVRGVLRHIAAHDGRELFGAGCHIAVARGIRRHRVVYRGHARPGPAWRTAAAIGVLVFRTGYRDTIGHHAGAGHAVHRVEVIRRAGADRLVPAYSVECRRHDLADIRTPGYWPDGPCLAIDGN